MKQAAVERSEASLPEMDPAVLHGGVFGFGPRARQTLRTLARRLLPLPPEGDAAEGLWLRQEASLTDWQAPPKTRATAGRAPAAWGPPDLVLALLESDAPIHRKRLRPRLAQCGDEALAVLLVPPAVDAAALHRELAPQMRGALGVFTAQPQAHEPLAHALLASLYGENLICIDFEDLRSVLAGAGIAADLAAPGAWRRLREWTTAPAACGASIGVFAALAAAPECLGEAFNRFGSELPREIERWEGGGTPADFLLACLPDSRLSTDPERWSAALWVSRRSNSASSARSRCNP